MTEGDLTPEAVQGVIRTTVPLLASIGMEVVGVAPRRVRTRMPFSHGIVNHIGTAYAGALFSFLEATGGALVLVSFDVSRWIPVIVEGTIRFLRPAPGAVEADCSLTEAERDAVHGMLEADPKASWTLTAAATAEDGRIVCEADLVYRFRAVG